MDRNHDAVHGERHGARRLAGALHDLTGDYTASILAAFGFNVLNVAIAGWLIARDRAPPAGRAIPRPA